jgi:hypothetical protein
MSIIKEVEMFNRDSVKRLDYKSPMHAIQVDLQQGYALSSVEAKVVAHRLQQLVDEQTGYTRSLGQIIYQAIDIADRGAMDGIEYERWQEMLPACWGAFDGAPQRARGRELRKGPRGGGRDVDKIVAMYWKQAGHTWRG